MTVITQPIVGLYWKQAARISSLEKKPENGGNSEKASIVGKSPKTDNFTVSKDGGDIDAITASTITSRAFLSAVREAYNTFAEKAAAK